MLYVTVHWVRAIVDSGELGALEGSRHSTIGKLPSNYCLDEHTTLVGFTPLFNAVSALSLTAENSALVQSSAAV
jgi:hypothetical protein